MIAIHKPAQLPAPPSFHHRRVPSAPVLTVQPTKTAGLLSITKPPPPAPKAPRQQRSPKPKPAVAAPVPAQRSPKPAPAQAVPLSAPAGSPSAEQRLRGRQNHSKENKGRRNASNSPPAEPERAPRRPAARRPQSFAAPKGADPFLVSPAELPAGTPPAAGRPVRPAPALAQPSGKLARRRRAGPDSPTPAPARAVPVPRAPDAAAAHGLARSAPAGRRVPAGVAFPVCDDTTDSEEDARFDDGPRTAPLARAPRTPSPRVRVPSAGFVSGAFDEDYLNTPTDDVRALLFGLSPAPPAFPTPAKDLRFANSQFQNSPSPEDLPTLSF